MINNNTTGVDRKKRIHFYTLGRRPIGCVTKYNPERQTTISTLEDYLEFSKGSEICKFCNRHANLPPEWILAAIRQTEEEASETTTTPAHEPDDQADSTDNESCSTNDTLSDNEPSML